MNKHHKKKLKRKLLRQLNSNYIGWKGKFKTILFKWPYLSLCNEIAGVQEMNGPVGQVFHLNTIKWTTTK